MMLIGKTNSLKDKRSHNESFEIEFSMIYVF